MSIEDDFYATIKLSSGEEIYSKVAASEEEGRTKLIVNNPITITGPNDLSPFRAKAIKNGITVKISPQNWTVVFVGLVFFLHTFLSNGANT